MDNSVDLPGYKYYVDAATGERPAVFVTFLNVVPDPATAVNGVLFPVDADALAQLDARERNYERRAVEVDGRAAWTYVGSSGSASRFGSGVASGTAVVSGEYAGLVCASFKALGCRELRRFEESTDPPGVPVRDLRRVDVLG
jgi:gamma-glutamylcyclotransferase (GGCT)/AIG2-like uncharacterized protein YtfP